MGIFERALELNGYAVEVRRHLHRHPELSTLEFETLSFIRDRLAEIGIPFVEVEDGGIIGELGDPRKGATVLLRADIDALPIIENPVNLAGERQVISENPGVMHACGHDAHTAMLLTCARILKEMESQIQGRILLMFERGEEGGGNIRQLLAYLLEESKTRVDAAHAIHVRPGIPTGKVSAASGPVMSGSCGFQVTLRGRGGHGSRPDLANSPLDCFAALHSAIKDLRMKQISPFDHATITISKVAYGNKGNVIDSELTFSGSARVFREEVADRFLSEFDLVLDSITKAYRCDYVQTPHFRGFPVVNHPDLVPISREAILDAIGDRALLVDAEPSMGSEPYSRLGKFIPAMMVHLGIDNTELGSGADLHTDVFDLDEAALPYGVSAHAGFALGFLEKGIVPNFTRYPGSVDELFDALWVNPAYGAIV